MPRTLTRGLLLAGLVVALPVLALWATGNLGDLARWAAAGQREAQDALARAIRAIRTGQPGAMAALLGVAFAYGVFHAAGPGHGKVLIGGYGVARRVRLGSLMALALVSSLAQATVAVLLVHGGIALFSWTREQVVGTAEDLFLPASHAAVALIGLWLALRGLVGLGCQGARPGHDHGRNGHHGHDHHNHGPHCTHRHAPSAAEVAAVTSPREALALVAGIAARPCTGALLLLVLTWQMGIAGAGIAGAYAMGLGTAAITVAVAGLAVWAREGLLATLSGGTVARALPVLELAAGLAIAGLSLMLLAQG